MQFFYLNIFIIIMLSIPAHLFGSNLDGTSSIAYKTQHHVFSNGESARGFVRMGGGFTIKPGAKATLDTVVSVSGSIDLRETGILQLVKDLNLDSNLTWSSGGYINGRGNSIILESDLIIPASRIIHIVGDTIINGKGKDLILDANAQIVIESNSTLSLKNLSIKNKRNNPYNPCLRIINNRGKLALDDVELAITGDMHFGRGELYIHNDVIFSGTSALIYTSTAPCFVAPSGQFFFDLNTTLSFAPTTALADQLFILQDRTSTLRFNGGTLKTTTSGMRLTTGNLYLENKVILESNAISKTTLSSLVAVTSQDYTDAVDIDGQIHPMEWHPSGNFIAIGGRSPRSGLGGFLNTDELRLYSFNGSVLTPLDSKDYSTTAGNRLISMAWNPAGTVLAIGGIGPVNPSGGFSNTHELRLYTFNGSSLTALTSVDYGGSSSEVRAIAWHPSGTALAIGGTLPTSTDEVQIYSFDGATLTLLTSVDFGGASADIQGIVWNPAGTILTVCGDTPGNVGGFTTSDTVRLYGFNYSSLTPLAGVNYGTNPWPMTWNSSGSILAVGGTGPIGGNELKLYTFNGSTLTQLLTLDYGTELWTMAWSADEKYLAIGGNGPTSGNQAKIYYFSGSSLSLVTSLNYGSEVRVMRWHPSGQFMAIGGKQASATGGFSDTNELRIYGINFEATSPQALSKSIVFGNSALGSSYDLNVEILGNAHVTLDGNVMDDSA